MDTQFGALISRLSSFYDASVNLNQSNNNSLLESNYFVDKEGLPKNALLDLVVSPQATTTNSNRTEGGLSSGIHPLLCSNKALVANLIKMLGLLQDFSLFIRAFKQIYALAGDGGNVLRCLLC